jgi:hypothetical protein
LNWPVVDPLALRGAPLTADGMSAPLADIHPVRNIDLMDIELEQRII